ncbi:MAG: c-type cytochrome domain-containing protein [Bryobacteraceae bacterium]
MRFFVFFTFFTSLLTADDGTDYFEKNIRPVLASRCYACHNAKLAVSQGDFYADSKDGLLKGGKSGVPTVVPGKPEESLLIKAIEGSHKDLKMPPASRCRRSRSRLSLNG